LPDVGDFALGACATEEASSGAADELETEVVGALGAGAGVILGCDDAASCGAASKNGVGCIQKALA